MRFHNITKDDMLNGDGLRVVLWVAGGGHHCDECQNPVTWNPDGGVPFTEESRKELFEALEKSYVSGITFSGGDPLFCTNEPEVLALAKEIRAKYPNKTIWLYTGYLWEYVKAREIVNYIDVLIDGPYVKQLRDTKLHWRGSANQRVIDVKESLEKGKLVLHCD